MKNYKWLCDECLSANIKIFKDKNKEMDCYCNECKSENYIISPWFIYLNKKYLLEGVK
tara:strand:+ start:51 stop:224 length:174 start_codon:yes stop_codon:yes gene_type:complete